MSAAVMPEGRVLAIVAHVGRPDAEGDVLLPGAIKDGARALVSAYGHDVVLRRAAPSGRATLRTDGDRVLADVQYFTATEWGREAAKTLVELGADTQWSFSFTEARTAPLTDEWRRRGARRLLSAVRPVEISPVLAGTDPDTTTLAAKCLGCGGGCLSAAPAPTLAETTQAELQRIAENVERLGRLVPALSEQGGLAALEFVEKVAALLDISPPEIRWFDPEGEESRFAGYVRPGQPGVIYLRRGLDSARRSRVILHELGHVYELRRWGRTTEKGADLVADALDGAMRALELMSDLEDTHRPAA